MAAKSRTVYHNLTTRYWFGAVADRIQKPYPERP